MSITNRTLLMKAPSHNCAILFIPILSILILTLSSYNHGFLRLTILQYITFLDTYEYLTSHIQLLSFSFLLAVKKQLAKSVATTTAELNPGISSFSGKQLMKVSRSGHAKQAKPQYYGGPYKSKR